jgi:mitochondrial fission protein ELM1
MSIEDKIAYLQSLVPQMEYVKKGDYVLAKHPNVFVDFTNTALDVLRELYDLFQQKTGRSLPDVEYYIGMAESRANFMRKAKFGDIVRVQDHNLVIDVWKPIEIALWIIQANL